MDKKYLSITPEVESAFAENRPVVALESTILSHGMPYPENVEFSHKVEEIIRSEGAVPATCALMGGYLKIGLSSDELELMCRAENVGKVSRRDMAVYLATGKTGATTAATTMMLAEMAGIHIFATGGIGGVHRRGETALDISADLQELANTSVAVVCTGAKSLPDIGLTLEYLETMGVPVIGLGTDDFPAFYSRKSGFKVDFNAQDPETVAWILHTKWRLGLAGGAVIANPMPLQHELESDNMETVIKRALAAAKKTGIRGKDTTPFLLARIKDYTEGVSFSSNLDLAYNNARSAAKIAVEYVKAAEQCIS